MKNSQFYFLLAFVFVVSCGVDNSNEPIFDGAPMAKIEEKILTEHGNKRTDNYFWMRLSDEQKNAAEPDAQTKEVLDYLNAENDYLKKKMAHTDTLQENLFNEITARLDPNEQSIPFNENGYSYYDRYEEGEDYPLYCRKKIGQNSKEEILLNGPEMGTGQDYFDIGGYTVSPDNRLIVYGVDSVSRRNYTLFVKDIQSGKVYNDRIENTTGFAVFANDNKTIFYTQRDEQTLRECFVYKHVLGTKQSDDVIVFEEKDETYTCEVYKSKSQRFMMIVSYQTMSTEYHFLDANKPNGEWRVVQPRQRGLEYSAEDYLDDFYIVTNDSAKNFRLMRAPIERPSKENWIEIIPHREDVLLEGIEIFKMLMVVNERKNGLSQLRVINWLDDTEHYVEFAEPTYYAYCHDNMDFNTTKLRFTYSSLTTPFTTFEYDMLTKEKVVLKKDEVLGGEFSPENYTSERIYATADDGTKIPISIVYKNGLELHGENPLLLYSYGSYGVNTEAYFSYSRLSLLDRGFVFALAHIRGGQEMGRQ